MQRLNQIEGFRGYLALGVLLTHLIHATGYDNTFGPLKDMGGLAVKCFIIISGFVIFFLIDARRESYQVYITRRFFRIFPVYIILFALSIPCELLAHTAFTKSAGLGWVTPESLAEHFKSHELLWKFLWFHVPAHIMMLHGLIPDFVLPNSSIAFLGPAWSLSLEWQFYLIAPFWFCLCMAEAVWKRLVMYGLCLLVVLCSRHFIGMFQQGAALPFHLEFFLFGVVCYFLYRNLTKLAIERDTIFPIVLIFCVIIYKWSGRDLGLMPFLIWAILFALMLEPAASISSRYLSPIFTNRISLWLGKISFSIYLSHMLVLYIMEWGLLALFPGMTQIQYLLMLTPLTVGFTIFLSAGLYFAIEAPFIKMGKNLTTPASINGPQLKL